MLSSCLGWQLSTDRLAYRHVGHVATCQGIERWVALISVFTPTHRGDTLERAYASLKRQTFDDFEWVLLLNGPMKSEDLPRAFFEDPRVKVYRTENQTGYVGALKYEACEHACGDLLVELDHDDELRSDCLQQLVQAQKQTPGGFYFSQAWERDVQGGSTLYSHVYGWKTRQTEWEGESIKVHECMPINARSLYQIYYAPNHVRAWSRQAYEKAGKYPSELEICDDQDLMIRTYLAGVPFVHIAECLYLQHGSPFQTQRLRNAEIQSVQARVGAKYLERLCLEWIRREGLSAYDLGGAHNKPAGYQSVDLHDADVIADVRQGLPFEDSSVGILRASDFLEHIQPEHVVHVMNECYRVLAPGGWLLTNTPSTDGRGAFQDPTHVSFWNSNSFWYYTQQGHMKYVPGLKAQFQLTRVDNYFPSSWHTDHLIKYVAADLWALKGQPLIGQDLTGGNDDWANRTRGSD